MLKPAKFLKDIPIHDSFQPGLVEWLKPWRMKTYVDILIVVDTEISTNPVNDFGIARVIELIRGSQVGCMKFRVDIALRSNEPFSVSANPSPTEPKYRGFRFNSSNANKAVIDKYEQIWCFGFKPNNSGSTDDAVIDQAFALPASNAELERLDQWMTEKKGGLFGTGDHHFLGASMCRKIPRLGTMRRWTNADGVPPIGTPARIDTLRPPSPDYEPGAPAGPLPLGNTPHQGDLKTQSIQWVAWKSVFWPFLFRRKRPHPVLCHPTLGPIDVMPDHAHEGLCVQSPNLNATKQFNAEAEYPDSINGGPKPAPQIIAFGSNLGDPPYNFAKGPQPARHNNPMISVYDGHPAGVGRVATDSTWHHWMDVNINAIRTENNDDWKKISRYFINLAVWLNPPGFSTKCFYLSVVTSHVQYPGFQEFRHNATTRELGQSLRQHLLIHYGPCWVTERIWDLVWELELIPPKDIFKMSKKFNELDVDAEAFEELVLGRMIEATMDQAEELKQKSGENMKDIKVLATPEKLFTKPVAEAINSFREVARKDLKVQRNVLSDFKA